MAIFKLNSEGVVGHGNISVLCRFQVQKNMCVECDRSKWCDVLQKLELFGVAETRARFEGSYKL